MFIDWQLVSAFVIITVVSFVLGAPLKRKWKEIPFFCLPTLGLIVFGGIVTPLLYFTGGWHVSILFSIVSVLFGFGIVSLFQTFKNRPFIKPSFYSVMLFIVFLGIVAGFLIQSSTYPVPGGIDPAIHTAYINHIVQFEHFNISYPLGIHIFVLFFETLSTFATPTILLALQVFLFVNIFSLSFYVIKFIAGKTSAGIIGMMVVFLDTSIFNNYLNGSFTHLLALVLILTGIFITLALPKNNSFLYLSILTLFYIASFYFHFITLFMLIPLLWGLRIYKTEDVPWLPIVSFTASLIVATPLLVTFANIKGFQIQFYFASFLYLLVELVILFFGKQVKKILFTVWFQVVLAGLGLLAFTKAFYIFDKIPEWYGWLILFWGATGAALILLKRLGQWYPILTFISGVSIFYYCTPLLAGKIDLTIYMQLLFYYGFTVPLILIGAVGLYHGFLAVSGKILKIITVSVLVFLVTLISISRFTDKSFISDNWTISRYDNNSGFGIFYNRDDVRVTVWARDHLPADAGVINPGGLHNSWASITERRILYPAYGVINSPESEKTHQAVVDLLSNQNIGCSDQLEKQKYEYILLPSQYVIHFRNLCATLLYESGDARLYKINERPAHEILGQAIDPYNLTKRKEISISGDYNIICKYCDNRFYYQFQNVGKLLSLPATGVVNVTIAEAPTDRRVNVIIDSETNNLKSQLVDGTQKDLENTGEYVLHDYLQKAGKEIRLQIKNISATSVEIHTILFSVE